jgi:hypothetical protein
MSGELAARPRLPHLDHSDHAPKTGSKPECGGRLAPAGFPYNSQETDVATSGQALTPCA